MPTPGPKAGEILVRVHATTVGRTDACALRAHPFFVRPYTGLRRPKHKILGLDFAGTVGAVGKGAAPIVAETDVIARALVARDLVRRTLWMIWCPVLALLTLYDLML